ncbi:PepSY-like domain-containing protein [Leadbetterella sp. DM7]|uniref:PepSY-like domain-containing protein n=1 Tax=Leadbetterella sp. DM7 TaxID=3235085 RepID=UPI00349E9816
MKKLSFILMLIPAAFMSACESQKVLAENEIPSAITTYVSTHFPAARILQAVKDKEGLSKSYDVILEGNISLEFNKKHEITSIESRSALPDSVIPEKILAYVKANYPNHSILQWELDDNRQQVELDNHLELEFNKAGDFLRIDS